MKKYETEKNKKAMERNKIMSRKIFLKLFSYFLLLVITACSEEYSEIFTTNNSSVIENELRNADKNTLVIFDINDVLFEQKEMLFKKKNDNLRKKLLSASERKITDKEEEKAIFSVVVQSPIVYIDKNFVNIIKNLQDRGIKVMALTNGLVGECGYVKSMDRLMLKQTRDMDYHFEKSWKHLKNAQIYITKIYNKKDRKILFMDGVVFANKLISKASKGECLLVFLKYANFFPKKIIFIDDKMKNLKSVSEICERNDITFVGFEYTGATNRNDLPPLDENHAKLQLYILKKKHKLLSDKEISRMLNYHW